MTSRPWPGSWLGTIRSTAVFAKTARPSSAPLAASGREATSWARMSVALMAFSQAMTKLNKGQTTEVPVKSEFGFHVIRVDDIREAQLPKLDEVKPQISQQLQQQKLAAFQEGLRKNAKVE